MTSNPYRKFERTVAGIFKWIGYIGAALLGLIFFVVIPVIFLAAGEPWYNALAPWIIIAAMAVVVELIFGVMFVFMEFIAKPWAARKEKWDREQIRLIPLDPRPYKIITADGFERITVEEKMELPERKTVYFAPLSEYNQHEWAYHERA